MLNARRITMEQQLFQDQFATLSARDQREVTHHVASMRHKSWQTNCRAFFDELNRFRSRGPRDGGVASGDASRLLSLDVTNAAR